jgi:large subunit ribosomal protein L20
MSRVSARPRERSAAGAKEAKGYYGRKHSSYRFAKEQVQRSGMYAYRDRRNRKRDFRRLWITRINAAARLEGMSYSELIHGLNQAEVEVNRKMLADIAVNDRDAFRRFVELAREGARRLAAAKHSTFPGGPSSRPAFSFQEKKVKTRNTRR